MKNRQYFPFIFLMIFLFLTTTFLIAADIEVTGAGVKQANGIYKQDGTFKGHPKYVKGKCEIRYKGCRSKWMLYIDDKHYYKNKADSSQCPLMDWQVACGAKNISTKVPEFKIATTNK